MANDNKEGAGVPVAVVGKGNGGGVGITYLPALYSLPHGTKLYATPPAVMPAAPSDAVRDVLRSAVAALPRYDVDYDHNLEKSEDGYAVRYEELMDAIESIAVAISQTMQPQADRAPSMDRFEHVIQWARDNYQDHSIASLCDGLRAAYYALCRPAEPAAGEQAGAVAWINGASLTTFGIDRERYPLGGGGDMATARYMRSDHHDTPLYLAAPAIAAREQCVTCGASEPFTGSCGTSDSDTGALCKRASPKEAPATPQGDDSGDLAARLLGRAQYIRDQGGVKSAELMEAAAAALKGMQPGERKEGAE